MNPNAFTTPEEQAVDRASWVSVAILAAVMLVGFLRLASDHAAPSGSVSVRSEVLGR